ncbi:hypothetical protein GCM10023225_08450 [Kineococcus glutinatus]|uniref:Cell wall binding repeat protein n=2 Tax=Kineococcus glutinatus TaxID=1070872 RepID=A0ABP9HDX6_9ACTN
MRTRSRLPLLALAAPSAALAAALAAPSAALAAAPLPVPADTPGTTPKEGVPYVFEGLLRVFGANRYETAAAASRGSFTAGPGGAVFIASGATAADALAAGPAAAAADAPLLLTAPTALPPATAAELARLAPATVHVVGGRSAVSDDVLAEIATAAPAAVVVRIAGPNRYATATEVAETFFPDADAAVLSRGDDFPDALSGGATAAAQGIPLLLTRPAALPPATTAWLREHPLQRATVVGGTAAVTEETAAALAEHVVGAGGVTRLAGTDRYSTAATVAAAGFADATTVVLATGDDFPDALAAVPVAAVNDAPLLLLPKTCTPVAVVERIADLRIERTVVLGGPSAVPNEALATVCP